MSKVAEEPIMALTKKPRIEDMCKVTQTSAHFIQAYDHKKPWSLAKFPWYHVESHCFKVTLSEERGMGMNLVTTSSEGDHFHVFLYGSDPIHCTDRDGCGGIVQNGHILQWKCNCLLHIECGPVCTDVMVVRVDIQHAVDGCIEDVVRDMFHVEKGEYDMTRPCWLPGSIADNHSASWMQQAQTYSQDYMQLKLGYHKLQQQIVAQKQDMEQQLQRHKNAIKAIAQVVTCAWCKKMVPESFPCKMAACGHFLCTSCHEEYYFSLGISQPRCIECRSNPGPKNAWHTVHFLTGVVAAINNIERQAVEQIED